MGLRAEYENSIRNYRKSIALFKADNYELSAKLIRLEWSYNEGLIEEDDYIAQKDNIEDQITANNESIHELEVSIGECYGGIAECNYLDGETIF